LPLRLIRQVVVVYHQLVFMELRLQILLPETLSHRNPELTELGKKIIKHSVELLYEGGFDSFNFKKLAAVIGTTEAGVYRYFENKHQLLMYLTAWYWSWLEYQIQFQTNHMADPVKKLETVLSFLSNDIHDDLNTNYINETLMHHIVTRESVKTYGDADAANKQVHFKPYVELCLTIEKIILGCRPNYCYPKSLATTIVKMSHYHHFVKNNLPSLADKRKVARKEINDFFLCDLVRKSLGLEN